MSFELGSQDLLKALGCMILSGPFLTGFTQVSRSSSVEQHPLANACTGRDGLSTREVMLLAGVQGSSREGSAWSR